MNLQETQHNCNPQIAAWARGCDGDRYKRIQLVPRSLSGAASDDDRERYITNENYPGKVFDKVERRWIDKKRREAPRKAKTGNGQPFDEPPPNLGEIAPPPPPAIVKRGGDFLSEYEPISYTWGGFVPSSSIYGVTAKTGHGKTALLICGSIAVIKGNNEIGEPLSNVLGCEVERGRVAYITKENPDDFRMKLAVNCFVHGVDREALNKRLLVLDGRSDSPEQICEALQRDAEHKGLFQLIPYDTFQAGYAADPSAKDFNENLGVLRFVERLRKLCGIIGKPTALVGCHPTKSAGEDQLIPFGGGSSYNELDGNLTLWKDSSIKLYWIKVRGPEFEPRYFRIEKLSCPDIVDKKGHQILLPVMRPSTEHDVETRERGDAYISRELLKAMLDNPGDTQADWGRTIQRSKGIVNKHLQKLKKDGFAVDRLGKWSVTKKGKDAVS